MKTQADYESITPSNLGLLDSKTADPNNFDSQGKPLKIHSLKAYARLQKVFAHKETSDLRENSLEREGSKGRN